MCDTHLNHEQQQQFQRDGYLVLPAVFSDDEVERMRGEADRILELMVNSSIALRRASGRLEWSRGRSGFPVVRKIQPINDLSEYLTGVSNDPRLLDPMRDIMGDEPVLMEEKLNGKEPLHNDVSGLGITERAHDGFPIHNDWAYFKSQDYPQEVISSAVSFDQCTPDNGPLRVWPGSHKSHLEHESIPNVGLQVVPGLIDSEAGIDILAPAGSVMFFHTLLVHNSRPNTTDLPRRLMIYSHYPARFNMGHDVRNGPGRRREQTFEQQYLEMVRVGEYTPQFHLR